MKAGGEDNKAKAKLAAVLAAVNFWVKQEGKVEPTLKVKVEEKEFSAAIKLVGDRQFEVEVDGEKFKVKWEEDSMIIIPLAVPVAPVARAPKPEKPKIALEEGEILIKAQTSGKVIKVLVKSGDEVKENTPLVVIEAMKMELEVTAPSTGKVRKVIVKVGDEVKIGDPLIILKKMS